MVNDFTCSMEMLHKINDQTEPNRLMEEPSQSDIHPVDLPTMQQSYTNDESSLFAIPKSRDQRVVQISN